MGGGVLQYLINGMIIGFIIISSHAYSEDQCSLVIRDLFQNQYSKQKIQEFSRLQGELTLYKLSHALFQRQIKLGQKLNTQSFKAKIVELLDQLGRPDLSDIKETFEKQPLSRQMLSKITPLISNILNDQLKHDLGKDAVYFYIGLNDMKILALLGDLEEQGSQLTNIKFDDRVFSTRSHPLSALNFAKKINYLFSRKKLHKGDLNGWRQHIFNLINRMNEIINELDIEQKCLNEIEQQCFDNSQTLAITPLSVKIHDMDDENILSQVHRLNTGNLSVGDINVGYDLEQKWQKSDPLILEARPQGLLEKLPVPNQIDPITTTLLTAKTGGNISSSASPVIPAQKPQSQQVTIEPDPSLLQNVTPLKLNSILLKKQVDKVLGIYSYFFDRKYLQDNPDMTYAIANAIDNDYETVQLGDKVCILPQMYDRSQKKTSIRFPLGLPKINRSIEKGRPELSYYYWSMKSSPNIPYYQKIDIPDTFLQSLEEEILKDQRTQLKSKYCFINRLQYGNKEEYEKSFKQEVRQMATTIKSIEAYNQEAKKSNRVEITAYPYGSNLCDAKTGHIIAQSPENFCQSPVSVSVGPAKFSHELEKFKEDRMVAIMLAIIENRNTYIWDDHVYYLTSLVPIGTNTNNNLEIERAIKGKESYAQNGKNIIDVETNRIITFQEIEDFLRSSVFSKIPRSPFENKNSIKLPPMKIESKQAWFLAIKRNQEYFLDPITKKEISTRTGLDYVPEQEFTLMGKKYINYEDERDKWEKINELNDKEMVKQYHLKTKNNHCSFYSIVDKKRGRFEMFYNDKPDKPFISTPVLTGKNIGDERTKYTSYIPGSPDNFKHSNKMTGAGVYKAILFCSDHPNYELVNGCTYTLGEEFPVFDQNGNLTQSDRRTIALHGIPRKLRSIREKRLRMDPQERRMTGGCPNISENDFNNLKSFLAKENPNTDCPLYILPEETDINRFMVVNEKIIFTPKDRSQCGHKGGYGCGQWHNYSKWPENNSPRNIIFAIDTEALFYQVMGKANKKTKKKARDVLKRFTEYLQNQKDELAQKFKLSDIEYNTLARLTVATLGIESEFGQGWMYHFKENYPDLVKIIKRLKEQSTTLSKGPTQIKNVDKFLDNYQIVSDSIPLTGSTGHNVVTPNISKVDLYRNMDTAALATMLVYIDILQQMKSQSDEHALLDFSTRKSTLRSIETMAYYYYSGSSYQVRGGMAAPDINIKMIKLAKMLQAINLYQEVEM